MESPLPNVLSRTEKCGEVNDWEAENSGFSARVAQPTALRKRCLFRNSLCHKMFAGIYHRVVGSLLNRGGTPIIADTFAASAPCWSTGFQFGRFGPSGHSLVLGGSLAGSDAGCLRLYPWFPIDLPDNGHAGFSAAGSLPRSGARYQVEEAGQIPED